MPSRDRTDARGVRGHDQVGHVPYAGQDLLDLRPVHAVESLTEPALGVFRPAPSNHGDGLERNGVHTEGEAYLESLVATYRYRVRVYCVTRLPDLDDVVAGGEGPELERAEAVRGDRPIRSDQYDVRAGHHRGGRLVHDASSDDGAPVLRDQGSSRWEDPHEKHEQHTCERTGTGPQVQTRPRRCPRTLLRTLARTLRRARA